jgi:hypothetical protein
MSTATGLEPGPTTQVATRGGAAPREVPPLAFEATESQRETAHKELAVRREPRGWWSRWKRAAWLRMLVAVRWLRR